MFLELLAFRCGVIVISVSDLIVPARVSWSIDSADDAITATFVCVDDITQQRYRFVLPLHTLPALAALLDRIVDERADDLSLNAIMRFP